MDEAMALLVQAFTPLYFEWLWPELMPVDVKGDAESGSECFIFLVPTSPPSPSLSFPSLLRLLVLILLLLLLLLLILILLLLLLILLLLPPFLPSRLCPPFCPPRASLVFPSKFFSEFYVTTPRKDEPILANVSKSMRTEIAYLLNQVWNEELV
jgi:hypothetical protein